MLLLAPIASATTGVALSMLFAWAFAQLFCLVQRDSILGRFVGILLGEKKAKTATGDADSDEDAAAGANGDANGDAATPAKGKRVGRKGTSSKSKKLSRADRSSEDTLNSMFETAVGPAKVLYVQKKVA